MISPLRRHWFPILLACAFLSVMVSCTKHDPLVTGTPKDYYPLAIGKYIIYRMDSLKFINVGSQIGIYSYHAKEVVTDSFTDNQNRPSYRVTRFLNDTLESGDWQESIAYLVTPTFNDVQVVENNQRFIKLVTPVQPYQSWKGNAYIDTKDSPATYLDDWDYVYANIDEPFAAAGGPVDSTVTVNESDYTNGDSATTQIVIFSQEIYGRGIGPVYRKFLHSQYQAPNVELPAGGTVGYGLTFSMISHN